MLYIDSGEVKVIRTRRKTIAICINPDGSVAVRAPLRTNDEYIKEFLSARKEWIIRKQRFIKQRDESRYRKKFLSGEEFLYLGYKYKLNIVDSAEPVLTFDNGFYLSSRHIKDALSVFTAWYKERVLEKIPARVNFYTAVTGAKYARIKVTSAKRRWGSCSGKGNLNFNWRLIMAPEEVIDYVVVHETVHLTVRNHSRDFWSKVEQLFPDYKICRKWLRNNGHLLVL